MKSFLLSLLLFSASAFAGDVLDLEGARELIVSAQAECVLLREGAEPAIERGRGVSPLLRLYDANTNAFRGATVADKIIGRAAAFIAIRGGARSVYAEIMSEPARRLLAEHGIETGYTLLVPQIRNDARTGLCPLEDSVREETDPEKALAALRARIAALASGARIETPALPPSPRILVAFYSRTGTTRAAAEAAAHALGADLFEIRPSVPYSADNADCTARAKRETADHAPPALAAKLARPGDYDTIFVGAPIWFGTMALPVRSFLEGSDWSGKTMIPFFTHGGGGARVGSEDFARLTGSRAPAGAWTGSTVSTNVAAIAEWARTSLSQPDHHE